MEVSMFDTEEDEVAFGRMFAVLMRPVPPALRSEVLSKVTGIINEYTVVD